MLGGAKGNAAAAPAAAAAAAAGTGSGGVKLAPLQRRVHTPRQMIRNNAQRELVWRVHNKTPDGLRYRRKLALQAARTAAGLSAADNDLNPISAEAAAELTKLKLSRRMTLAVRPAVTQQFQAAAAKLKAGKHKFCMAWKNAAADSANGDDDPGISTVTDDPYESRLLRVIETGELHKCRLVRRKGGVLALFATADIEVDEPVGVDCGVLREKSEFEKAVPSSDPRSISSYGLDPDLMAALGYTGPELVVEDTSQCCETTYIQDCRWNHLGEGESANVGPHIVFHTATARPYLVLFAKQRIPKDTELFLDYGAELWDAFSMTQLENVSAASTRQHAYIQTLEALCVSSGLAVPDVVDTDSDESSDEDAGDDDGDSKLDGPKRGTDEVAMQTVCYDERIGHYRVEAPPKPAPSPAAAAAGAGAGAAAAAAAKKVRTTDRYGNCICDICSAARAAADAEEAKLRAVIAEADAAEDAAALAAGRATMAPATRAATEKKAAADAAAGPGVAVTGGPANGAAVKSEAGDGDADGDDASDKGKGKAKGGARKRRRSSRINLPPKASKARRSSVKREEPAAAANDDATPAPVVLPGATLRRGGAAAAADADVDGSAMTDDAAAAPSPVATAAAAVAPLPAASASAPAKGAAAAAAAAAADGADSDGDVQIIDPATATAGAVKAESKADTANGAVPPSPSPTSSGSGSGSGSGTPREVVVVDDDPNPSPKKRGRPSKAVATAAAAAANGAVKTEQNGAVKAEPNGAAANANGAKKPNLQTKSGRREARLLAEGKAKPSAGVAVDANGRALDACAIANARSTTGAPLYAAVDRDVAFLEAGCTMSVDTQVNLPIESLTRLQRALTKPPSQKADEEAEAKALAAAAAAAAKTKGKGGKGKQRIVKRVGPTESRRATARDADGDDSKPLAAATAASSASPKVKANGSSAGSSSSVSGSGNGKAKAYAPPYPVSESSLPRPKNHPPRRRGLYEISQPGPRYLLKHPREVRLQIVDVLDPTNPCRKFTPPDWPARGALATAAFETGDPIVYMIGELTDRADTEAAQMYACDVFNEQYKKRWDAESTAACVARGEDPDTHALAAPLVSNYKYGNEARFINDCHGYPNPKAKINCCLVGHYDPDTRLPYTLIEAAADIAVGDELILDYGVDYWRTMRLQAISAHAEYFARSLKRVAQLHALLHHNAVGHAIPPTPLQTALRAAADAAANRLAAARTPAPAAAAAAAAAVVPTAAGVAAAASS